MRRGTRYEPRTTVVIRALMVVALVALAGAAAAQDAHGARLEGSVLQVIDGERVLIRSERGGDHEIRLRGVDAPDSTGSDPECGATQARAATAGIAMPGRAVRVTGYRTRRPLRPGRRLTGYVAVEGRDLGVTLIRAGWAQTSLVRGDDRVNRYRRAEARAKHVTRGVWARCGTVGVASREPGSPNAQGFSPCDGGWDPGGRPGTLFRQFEVRADTCERARRVIRAWVRRRSVHKRRMDAGRLEAPVLILGWSCRGEFQPSSSDRPYFEGGCFREGNTALRFMGGPIRR